MNLQPSDFQDNLEWLYESVKMDNSTPTFIVLVNKTIVLKTAGSNNWDKKVMPLLTELIKRKSAKQD